MTGITRESYLAAHFHITGAEARDVLMRLDAYDPVRMALGDLADVLWPGRFETEKEQKS